MQKETKLHDIYVKAAKEKIVSDSICMNLKIYTQKISKEQDKNASKMYLHVVHVHLDFLKLDLQVQNLSLSALDVVPQ